MTISQSARPQTPLRQYLFDLTLHGIKLGLDNIQALLHAAHNPHLDYPTIHVGGTNGKGSVVALLAAMLQAAGYRVGRFTSPHLIDVSERFLIDGVPIEEPALEEQITFFQGGAEGMAQCPTFFEMNTAMAFRHFSMQKVDVALIEVGMGGRFDSTNVVAPVATAITNIALEHTSFLGDTIAKIAYEKAGIIKAGVPVITTETHEDALTVFRDQARELGAPLLELGVDSPWGLRGTLWDQRFDYAGPTMTMEDVPLALPGRYQGANAAVAVALAERLTESFPKLTQDHVERGLRGASWPCRLEKVLDDPPVYIDVAHNVAGAQRLAEVFEDCIVVFAASSDKDAAGMLAALRPIARTLILTQFSGKRATPVADLAALLEPGTYECVSQMGEAIGQGLQRARAGCPLLLTGSIYAAGEGREYLIENHGAQPPRF